MCAVLSGVVLSGVVLSGVVLSGVLDVWASYTASTAGWQQMAGDFIAPIGTCKFY